MSTSSPLNTTLLPSNETTTNEGSPSSTSILSDNPTKIIYIVIGILGVLGNAFVLFVIYMYTKIYQRLGNVFVINQSVMDLVVGVFLIATTVAEDTGKPLHGLSGELLCRLWYTKTFLWSTLVSSTYNFVILSIERYFEIVHPILHKQSFTKTVAYTLVVLAWLSGYVYNFSYVLVVSGLVGDKCFPYYLWPSKIVQQAMGLVTVFVQFFIPFFMLIYFYGRIALVIHGQVKKRSGSNNQASDQRMLRARTNVIKTFFIVGVCYALCWSWNQLYYMVYNFGYDVDFTNAFYHATVVAVFLNCCINPFIYTFKYADFQKGIRKMLRIHNVTEDTTMLSATGNTGETNALPP